MQGVVSLSAPSTQLLSWSKVCGTLLPSLDYMFSLTLSFPSSKIAFSRPFKEKCIGGVGRIAKTTPLAKVHLLCPIPHVLLSACDTVIPHCRAQGRGVGWGSEYPINSAEKTKKCRTSFVQDCSSPASESSTTRSFAWALFFWGRDAEHLCWFVCSFISCVVSCLVSWFVILVS